uniref:MAGI family member, X-linked n=1 Tax=Nannospalax galili TaxID=1026970 RepID=A0A8C6R4G4_NANGA
MESRAGNTADPRGSRGGRRFPVPGGPSARQLLARLNARPLAARAAADMSALVRKAGATLRLRSKEAVSVMDSADIEVTDSRLPHATLVEHQPQHRRSEILGTCTGPHPVTQSKASYILKPTQAAGRFSVELVQGPSGFGLTLSGGHGASGDAPLIVHGLLKDGPAQQCGHLQAGDLVLHINGESTQGLTHAQVVDRIRAGGPRLHLVLCRFQETYANRLEGVRTHQKRDRPHPRGRESRSAISPALHWPKTQASPEPSPEAADGRMVPTSEQPTEDLNDYIPRSPGPWLLPSEERLLRALGVPGATQLAQEIAAGRRRH